MYIKRVTFWKGLKILGWCHKINAWWFVKWYELDELRLEDFWEYGEDNKEFIGWGRIDR